MILNKFVRDNVIFNISEVKRPDAEAKLIAENIASQLRKAGSF